MLLLRVFFFMFSERKIKINSFGTKKLLKIKLGKLSISFLFIFFEVKKTKHLESILVEEEKLPCLLYLIQVF